MTETAPREPFHVGLDLDNTIISFDRGFAEVAAELGLLPDDHGLHTKEAVKSLLWARPDGEQLWMRLQGQMYGRYIDHGRLFEGVPEFLREMHAAGAKLSIVSHKTRYGHFDANRVSLWDAAFDWLERRSLFAGGFGLHRENVHLLETREEKLATIGWIGCDVFIDDLPEVLLHPAFPRGTTGIWFASGQDDGAGRGLVPHPDWASILAAARKLAAAQAAAPALPALPR